MRLTRKLTLALAFAILAVLGLDALLVIQSRAEMFESAIQRDADVLGRTIAVAAARIWRTAGESQARDLVQHANEQEGDVSIRWVFLDAPADNPRRPEVPREQIGPLAPGSARSIRWRAPGSAIDSLYTYHPIAVPLSARAIEVRESLEPERAYVRHTIVRGALTTGVLVSMCAAVAMALGAAFVGRPVRRLVEQARRVGAGDLSARLDLRQRDEIGELAAEMNIMVDRLSEARVRLQAETAARTSALQQLRHADRLTTVGKVAAGLAHEVGTPLNVITGHAQLITDEYAADTPAHRNALIVAQQADRVASTIRQLLDFARTRSTAPTRQELGGVVRETAALLSSVAHRRHVTIDVDLPDAPVWGRVDPAQMMQALANLVVNGIQSMPGGGTLTLKLDRRRAQPPAEHEEGPGDFVCMEVIDGGVGIAPEHLPRLFEPFFTTKEVGDGTGLGLSITYEIVREHGGWIAVESAPGAGSRFAVFLRPLEAA